MDKNQIRELFRTHGLTIAQKDVWDVNGKPVILHSALERLAAQLGLVWDMPQIVRQTDVEVVVLVRATRKDGIAEWSFGEVKISKADGDGGNYKVKGKQPGYPFAMAEKRGKDRVIVKLAGLHGAYSEEEADEFSSRNRGQAGRQGFVDDGPEDRVDDERPQPEAQPEQKPETKHETEAQPETKPATHRRATDAAKTSTKSEPTTEAPANDDESDDVKDLRKQIKSARTINAVTDLMLKPETQEILNRQTVQIRDELRDEGKKRLVALGWPGKQKDAAA